MWVIVGAEDDVHARDAGEESLLRKPLGMGQGFLRIVRLEAEESEVISIEKVGEVLSDTINFECTVRTEKVSLKGRE